MSYISIVPAAGSGTVTSVGETINSGGSSGIFTITGSPVVGAGTIDLATAGTSGGIPYFSSGTIISSSAALAANALVKGGGAGVTPASSTVATDDGTTLTYIGTGGVLSTTSGGLKAGANGGAAGVLTLLGSTSGSQTLTTNSTASTATLAGSLALTNITATSGNGAGYNLTSSSGAASAVYGHNQESMTLNTGGTTTDSAANLLPANSLILGVTARITTTITTAANWSLGDTSTAARFAAANSTLTAGTTSVGMAHWAGTVAIVQAAAAKLRITTNANPGAGVIHIDVFFITFTAPTS